MRCRFATFELDLARRELRDRGVLQPLQPLAFELLGYLVRQRHRVVPKEELLRELWPDAVVTDASLQRAVSLVRRALGDSGRTLLYTHARHGYRFGGDVVELEPGAPEDSLARPPRYVRRGDVHVAYRTAGAGPVDVVLVLGWSVSMRCALELEGVAQVVRALASRARVVLFDKRGTGASDRVKAIPSLGQRVEDLEAVLDAVRSPGAVVVGFSEGGPLAITLALSRPDRVRALALVGAFARMAAAADHPAGWPEGRVAGLRAYLRQAWGTGATLRAIVPERHLTPALRAWAERAEQDGASPGAALDLLEMNLSIDVRARLPEVAVPTVVLHAELDPVIPVGNGRALAAAIPRARLVEVPGDDHTFLFQERARLASELCALADRVGGSGRHGR
jgi:pimeloyl-ACP methyl ester carboxylesterase/DNA-binding winged helix-turn-helix (wHTH) protein